MVVKASRASTGPSSSTPASPSSARPGADAEETTGAEKPPEPEPLPPPASSKDQNLGFFEDELRGFRLLKAAGLTNDQRVLTLTRNVVSFEKIRQALRALFDESDLSARQPRRKQAWYAGDRFWGWDEWSWEDEDPDENPPADQPR